MTISREALAVDMWPAIGFADPGSLTDTWRQMHAAARALAEVGACWGRPSTGGTHAAFAWSQQDAGWIIEGHGEGDPERRVIGWLDFAAGSVWLERETPQEGAWIELEGRTVDDVRAWVLAGTQRLSGSEPRHAPEPASPPIDHPVGRGEPFDLPDTDARGDLESIYESAGLLLNTLGVLIGDRVAGMEGTVTPRLRPDRFNAESRFVFPSGVGASATRAVGVGVGPPDEIDEAGHWYVSPDIARDSETGSARPALPIGRWVDRGDGPPAAVLSLADIRQYEDGDTQMLAVTGFIAAALNACLSGP